MAWFYYVSVVWAAGVITLLILAVRICYRIEYRSGIGRARSSVPVYASIVPVAFNMGVARDAETQAMRRRMLLLLLGILVAFAAFGILINLAEPYLKAAEGG